MTNEQYTIPSHIQRIFLQFGALLTKRKQRPGDPAGIYGGTQLCCRPIKSCVLSKFWLLEVPKPEQRF